MTLFVLVKVLRGGSELVGFVYLPIFGLGSIGGILLMSTLMGLPFVLTAKFFRRRNYSGSSADVAHGRYSSRETPR